MLNTLSYALLQATLLLASPAPDHGATPDPDSLDGYNKTIFIPYLNPFTSLKTPIIIGDIAGIKFQFPVDTGSTGLIIGASKLPQISANAGTPGHQYLDSSETLYVGRWVDVAVTFYGLKIEQAVSRLPILVVDKSWYCPEYKKGVDKDKCPNKDATSNHDGDIVSLGVGFGLGVSAKYNPFLNVKVVDQDDVDKDYFRDGYYIGTDGIFLGLTNKNTDTAAWVSLDHGNGTYYKRDDDWAGKYDWKMLKTSFKVNNQGPYSGSALFDTGVAEMYLQSLPAASIPNATVNSPVHDSEQIQVAKPGTKLKFGFPALGYGNVAGYGFTVGDKEFPSQPYFVQAVSDYPGPYVNTGRKFLWGFSIAYDAVGGRLGFICLKCKQEKKTEEPKGDANGEWQG
jgi:hypothetical protein